MRGGGVVATGLNRTRKTTGDAKGCGKVDFDCRRGDKARGSQSDLQDGAFPKDLFAEGPGYISKL